MPPNSVPFSIVSMIPGPLVVSMGSNLHVIHAVDGWILEVIPDFHQENVKVFSAPSKEVAK